MRSIIAGFNYLPKPSAWLYPALFALAAISQYSCGDDEAGSNSAICYPEEHWADNANCGCAGVCHGESVCYLGECCNPEDHKSDQANCNCQGPCPEGHTCRHGNCCDPAFHLSDDTNCGCSGECEEFESCVEGACACSVEKTIFDDKQCGCNGPCLPGMEVCLAGECACDVVKNLYNTENCACGGSCAHRPHCIGPEENRCQCVNGACQCLDAFVLCAGLCEPKSESICVCDPAENMANYENCACKGPCPSGWMCYEGQCQCDPLSHLADSTNCGCDGPCTKGRLCSNGACVCPEGTIWCGLHSQCTMPSSCCEPSTHQSNASNCGCQGPCASGEKCEAGQCACDPLAHLDDSTNCACKGGCAELAYEGNKPLDSICMNGDCVCPPGTTPCQLDGDCSYPAHPGVGMRCVSENALSAYCGNCYDACQGGETCITSTGCEFQCD